MTAVIGQLLLTLALAAAIALLMFRSSRLVRPLIWIQFAGLAGALLVLMWAMATLDYSLIYVLNQASNTLPMLYRITGTWGGHAGSLLLWSMIIAGWATIYAHNGPISELRRTALNIMALINIGFMSLLQLPSPFKTIGQSVLPSNGHGLNPMLQDIGLVIHPPMLYMGYAGIVLIFAMVMAKIWHRQPVAEWFYPLQKALLQTWCWLTIGIALGSWWAYLQLGWGGWWFWDPVENASLMPWLTLTGMLHLNVLNRQGVRVGNAMAMFSIATLVLMLIGMFIVRSGVMTSVHSFASSPKLGLAMLIFIMLASLIGCLLLLVQPPHDDRPSYTFSRPIIVLMAFITMLVLACATILLGTIYPIILEILKLGRISVGPAYFNTFFTPLTFTCLVLLLLTVVWNKQYRRISVANGVHLGLVLVVIAATLSSVGTAQRDLRMTVDQSVQVGEYEFQFTGTTPRLTKNFVDDYGFVDIYRDQQLVVTVNPAKRLYQGFGQVMTEVGHHPGLARDFYVVLGEPFDDGSWAMRFKVIPFMSMLWLGAALMVLSTAAGILLYLRRRVSTETIAATNFEQSQFQENPHAPLAP